MSIPDLVIREIRARPVVAPLPRPIRTASGDVLDAPTFTVQITFLVTGAAHLLSFLRARPTTLSCRIAVVGERQN